MGAIELNPVGQWAFGHGLPGLILLKAITSLILIYIIYRVQSYKLAVIGISIVSGAYLAITINNILAILESS